MSTDWFDTVKEKVNSFIESSSKERIQAFLNENNYDLYSNISINVLDMNENFVISNYARLYSSNFVIPFFPLETPNGFNLDYVGSFPLDSNSDLFNESNYQLAA